MLPIRRWRRGAPVCGDGSGATETSPAVDQHVEAQSQPIPDGLAGDRPCVLESRPRRPPVGDRRVPPFHVSLAHRTGETAHGQEVELLVGDEAHHRGRAPALNRVEIGVEIPRPRPGHAGGIGLPGAHRDPDATMALAGCDCGDAEWAGFAGSCCRHARERSHVQRRDAEAVYGRGNVHDRCRHSLR